VTDRAWPQAAPAAYGLRSEDGLWWWDGQGWQPVPAGVAGAEPAPVAESLAEPVRASWWRRLIPYLLVVMVGLLCAEFISSSTAVPIIQPEVAFVPLNVFAYGPFYLTLLLISARWGPLSFRTYYIFGALLGLTTETAITNLAWGHNETLKPVFGTFGGFGIWELLFLVFTYHPVLSTAVPFLLVGHYFGLAVPAPIPARMKPIILYGLPVYGAMAWAMATKPFWQGALATAANMLILTAVIALHRRFGARPRFRYGRLAWTLLIAFMALLWIAGLVARYVPPPPTLIATLVGMGLLAWLSVRSARLDSTQPRVGFEPSFSWRSYSLYLAYFAVVFLGVFGVLELFVVASELVGIVLIVIFSVIPGAAGTLYLIITALRVALTRRPRHPEAFPPSPAPAG
jgi:hypothetical protein